MVISDKENIFDSRDAILLAAMSYQTYPFFLEEKLILPKGYELRYTIRAFANVERPTEEVFGFIAESKDKIVIAFRGYLHILQTLLQSMTYFKYHIHLLKMGEKPHADLLVSISQQETN